MFAVDLNCDLGESFGNYKCGLDEEVIPFISSESVTYVLSFGKKKINYISLYIIFFILSGLSDHPHSSYDTFL